ncbi:MAG: MFS transporter [Peptococcaceae bacterium]|jgi:FSR family fosmidomycin resistance protein-like MFS transporter|nr:MFS transporter [Peptococcaceae bacterium]
MKFRYVIMLAFCHMMADINQGSLPALLPFLMVQHNLSYALAANLIFATNISSSLIQPLFGILADRRPLYWIMPLGLVLAGIGVALTGYLPNYWSVFIFVAISGIGVAAVHPIASRLVNKLSGDRKEVGISLFSSAGTLGFALGPILAALILMAFGIRGSLLLLVLPAVVAVVILCNIPQLNAWRKQQLAVAAQAAEAAQQSAALATGAAAPLEDTDDWKPFGVLMGAIFCRSICFTGLNAFLPLYWIHELHQPETAGSVMLTTMLVIGAITSAGMGRLIRRYGCQKMMKIGFTATIPALTFLLLVNNVIVASILIVPVALAMFTSFNPMVILGQRYLHNHIGLASGVTLGVAVSVGGIFAPLLGVVADHYSIRAALMLLPVFSFVALILSFFCPEPTHRS